MFLQNFLSILNDFLNTNQMEIADCSYDREIIHNKVSEAHTWDANQIYYDKQKNLHFCWDKEANQRHYCVVGSSGAFEKWLEIGTYDVQIERKVEAEEASVLQTPHEEKRPLKPQIILDSEIIPNTKNFEMQRMQSECLLAVPQCRPHTAEAANYSAEPGSASDEAIVSEDTTNTENLPGNSASSIGGNEKDRNELAEAKNISTNGKICKEGQHNSLEVCKTLEKCTAQPVNEEFEGKRMRELAPECTMSGLLTSTLSVEFDATCNIDTLLENVRIINENLWRAEIPDRLEYLEVESQALRAKADQAYARSQELIASTREQLFKIESMEGQLSDTFCLAAEIQFLGTEALKSSLKSDAAAFISQYSYLLSKT